MIVRIRGPLREAALRRAIDRLTARHEALRTTFTGAGHRLTQVVNAPAPVVLHRADLPEHDEDALQDALARELATAVDAAVNPLRATLWRMGPDEHVLCLAMHHLVTDAWSCGVLYRELAEMFEDSPQLPPATQYIDFSDWQHEFLHSPQAQRHREYWARQLHGMELPALPLRPRTRQRVRTTAIARADVPADVAKRLRAVARTGRTTPFAVLLAAYYATLHLRTEQRDLAVASLFANRSRPGVAGTIGFVANMVVLRAQLPAGASFAEVVDIAGRTSRAAFVHESIPYQLLPIPAATVATQRVEDVMFQMLGEPITVSTRVAGLELQGVVPRGVARFDCELAVVPQGDGWEVSLFHATDRLAQDWARDLVDDYVALLSAVALDPTRPAASAPAPPRSTPP